MPLSRMAACAALAAVGLAAGSLRAADVSWFWNNAEGGDFAVRENWRVNNAVPAEAPGDDMYWNGLKEGQYTINFSQGYSRLSGNALRRFVLFRDNPATTDVMLDLGGNTVEMNSFLSGKHPNHAATEPDPVTGLRDPGFSITITNGTLNCFTKDGETDTLCCGIFANGVWNGQGYCGYLTLTGPDTEVNADKFILNGGTPDGTVGNLLSVIDGAKLTASAYGSGQGKSDLLVSGPGSRFDMKGAGVNVPQSSVWKFADGAEFDIGSITIYKNGSVTFDNVSTERPIWIREYNQDRDPVRMEIVNGSTMEFHSVAEIYGSNSFVRVSDSVVSNLTIWSQAADCRYVFDNAKVTMTNGATAYPSFQAGTDGWSVKPQASNNVFRIEGENTRIDLQTLKFAMGAKLEFKIGALGFAEIPLEIHGEFQSLNEPYTNTIELVVDDFCKKQPQQSVALMKWAKTRESVINEHQYNSVYNLTNEVYVTRKGLRKRASEIEGIDPFFGKVEIVENSADFRKGTLVYTAPAKKGMVIVVR